MISLRFSGYFLMLAGVLFIARMIPIFANIPEGVTSFPPTTPEQFVLLVTGNPVGQRLSHLMGLIAVPILWLGFFSHYQRYVSEGINFRGLVGITALTGSAILFAIALVIDGYIVPIPAHDVLDPTLITRDTALYLTSLTHETALAFFRAGNVFAMVGYGFFASPMTHGFLHSKWFGYTGMLMATVALIFRGLELPILMLFYFWIIALGISALRVHKRESQPAP